MTVSSLFYWVSLFNDTLKFVDYLMLKLSLYVFTNMTRSYFYADFNRFESRVFPLLVQLKYQG